MKFVIVMAQFITINLIKIIINIRFLHSIKVSLANFK